MIYFGQFNPKKVFYVFPVKPCLKKIVSLVNFGQKIKIWFGGSAKKNLVLENPNHAPQVIDGRPLTGKWTQVMKWLHLIHLRM